MDIRDFINKVELRGVVGRARILHIDGKIIARLSVMTDHAYLLADGTPEVDTEWHIGTMKLYEEQEGEFAKIQKGAKVHIMGRLHYKRFTGEDNVDRISTEIYVSKIIIIDPNGESDETGEE